MKTQAAHYQQLLDAARQAADLRAQQETSAELTLDERMQQKEALAGNGHLDLVKKMACKMKEAKESLARMEAMVPSSEQSSDDASSLRQELQVASEAAIAAVQYGEQALSDEDEPKPEAVETREDDHALRDALVQTLVADLEDSESNMVASEERIVLLMADNSSMRLRSEEAEAKLGEMQDGLAIQLDVQYAVAVPICQRSHVHPFPLPPVRASLTKQCLYFAGDPRRRAVRALSGAVHGRDCASEGQQATQSCDSYQGERDERTTCGDG